MQNSPSPTAISPPRDRISVGHPVDVATGVVFTAWKDVSIAGYVPLVWRRFYSTGNLSRTPLGYGWHTVWFMALALRQNQIVLINGEGQEIVFARVNDSPKLINPDFQMELYVQDERLVVYHWHHFQRFVFDRTADPNLWRLAWIENLSGDRAVAQYDPQGRLQQVEDDSGRALRAGYDAHDRIMQLDLRAPDGQCHLLARYEYDAADNLIRAYDAAGASIAYEYDSAGRLTRETNRLGGSFHFRYDLQGRCVHACGDGGYLERKLTYSPGSTRVTDGRGNTTRFIFNPKIGLTRIIDPLGGESKRLVAAGKIQEVDAAGGIRQRTLNEAGDLIESKEPGGATTVNEYDDRHLCIRRTDALGSTWTFDYDERAHPVGATDPGGNRWEFRCDDHGRISHVINPLGGTTYYRYDEFGNRVLVVEPDGTQVHLHYDVFSRLTHLVNRRGHLFTYDYDPCGRLLQIISGGRVLRAWRYDAEGNTVSVVDAGGRQIEYEYSIWSHRLACRCPLDAGPSLSDLPEVSWSYDVEGNVTRLVDAQGRFCEFSYDALNHLTGKAYPDGNAEEYVRDSTGRVLERRFGPAGGIRYDYDPAGRLAAKHLPDGTEVTFVWDKVGRLVKAQNCHSELEFEYDYRGNVTAEVQCGSRIESAYDPMGNRVEQRILGAHTVRYDYDSLQRLVEVMGPRGIRHQFAFSDSLDGPAWHAFSNQLVETLAFDRDQATLTQTLATGVNRSGKVVAKRDYSLDATNRVRRITDQRGNSRNLRYDGWQRLTGLLQVGSLPEEYQYDLSGNIISDQEGRVRRYDARNRITQAGGVCYTYDDAAGRIVIQNSGEGPVELQFDFEGQLLSLTDENGRSTSYEYDPLGRRVAKVIDGHRIEFRWNGNTLALEEEIDTGRQDWYFFVPDSFQPLSKLVVQPQESPMPQVFHFHLDLSGTPQELTDRSGRVVWRARYSAYGQAKIDQGEPALNPLRFAGQYWDAESGLHYNRFRYYSPLLGRYLTADPIGYGGGNNLYAYPADPLNQTDPLGLSCNDPDVIHIYHGTLDEEALAKTGFTTTNRYGQDRGAPYVCVSTDPRAAAEAIDPATRVDAQDNPGTAVLEGRISRDEWNALHSNGDLTSNQYPGFGHGLDTTETKARSPAGVAALNRAFGLPGGDTPGGGGSGGT